MKFNFSQWTAKAPLALGRHRVQPSPGRPPSNSSDTCCDDATSSGERSSRALLRVVVAGIATRNASAGSADGAGLADGSSSVVVPMMAVTGTMGEMVTVFAIAYSCCLSVGPPKI